MDQNISMLVIENISSKMLKKSLKQHQRLGLGFFLSLLHLKDFFQKLNSIEHLEFYFHFKSGCWKNKEIIFLK